MTGLRQLQMVSQGLAAVALEQLELAQLIQADQTRAHPIVDIVRVVRDRIGQIAQLGLQTRLAALQKAPPHSTGLDALKVFGISPGTMLEDALARLEA